MSDTDSVVLPSPLPSQYIGEELGKLKLEQEIVEGIFIRKKFYYIKNINNQEIIRASGLDSSHLNYKSFIRLLNGETLSILRTNFSVEWKELNIYTVKSEVIVHGLVGKIKTIHNTKVVNLNYNIPLLDSNLDNKKKRFR